MIDTYHINTSKEDVKTLELLIIKYNYYHIESYLKYHSNILYVSELLKVIDKSEQLYTSITKGIYTFEIHFKSALYHSLLIHPYYDQYINELIKEHKKSKYKQVYITISKLLNNHDILYVINHLTLNELLVLYKCVDNDTKKKVLDTLRYFHLHLDSNTIDIFMVRFKQLIYIRNRIMHTNVIEDLLFTNNHQYMKLIEIILSFV